MAFVLDASIAASWAFKDEAHPNSEIALAKLSVEEAAAPALLWYEIRNTLVVNERRKRITEAETTRFLRTLTRLPIRLDNSSDEAGVLRLARKHRLSVYDAVYLELAQREGLPLATLDAELERAARTENVAILGDRGKSRR